MLKLENVSKYYHANDTVALGLRRVNLEFEIGEFVAVTGESGSGKSTLLNVLSGLDTYEEGELYINGDETSYYAISDWESYRRQYIGFVFQSYNIIDSYSVLENVMIALKLQGYDKETRKQRALELIEKVGLGTHIHHKASKLSGGQKQRAVIARALAKDCPVIVCDEPTGNLDTESSNNILNLLAEISKDKLVIVVTHNYDEVKEFATRRIRLFDGEVIEDKKIKKTKTKTEEVKVAPYKIGTLGLLTLSLRNLYRTPRRSIFAAIIFVFIVSIFTLVYGNFVTVLNEDLSGEGSNVFPNQNEQRIVVTNYDYTPFTETQLNQLREFNDVVFLNEYDPTNDTMLYAFSVDDGYVYSNEYYVNPSEIIKKNDLKDGELPKSFYQIVAEDNSGYEVGDTMYISYYSPYMDWDATEQDVINQTVAFEVVGIVKSENRYYSSDIYVHKDLMTSDILFQKAFILQHVVHNYQTYISVDEMDNENWDVSNVYIHGMYEVDNTLEDNQMIIPQQYFYEFARGYAERNNILRENVTEEMVLNEAYFFNHFDAFSTTNIPVEVLAFTTVTTDNYLVIKVNQATYDMLFKTGIYQVSVHTIDRFDAEKLVDLIESNGFNAIYPTETSSPYAQLYKIIMGVVYGSLMFGLMLGMYFIVYLILKNIQLSKKKDYLIFRSIGASKSNLNKVTILELFITMVFSYVLVYTVLVFQSIYNFIPYIGNILKYFTFTHYLFLTILLLYLTYILGSKFNRKIFDKSVISALGTE